MTLVEFITPLKERRHRDRVLGVLYFKQKYDDVCTMTTGEIRQAMRLARVKSWSKVNISDVLAGSGSYVDSPSYEGGRRLWSLTPSGVLYVQELLGLSSTEPEIEHDIGSLSRVVSAIAVPQVKDYVSEALKCLQVDALRATVVFLWTGAIRTIHDRLLTLGTGPLNTALQKHDPKARFVKRIDDFAYIKDKTTLLVAQELGLLDKAEKDTLQEALGLRNRCGHPGNYKPGIKRVSSFVEDILSVVFT